VTGAAPTGVVAWITGLPSSGKSTLGRALAARLRRAGLPTALLDGDAARAALGRPAGRGEAERDAFYEALARLAALLARQGLAVVVAATAPRRAHRARARRLAPAFVEVHVATPAETCAARDPKRLWAASRAGRLGGLPGAGAAYQPPRRPTVTAWGGRDAAALVAAGRRIAEALRQSARRTGTRRRPKWPGAGSKRPAMGSPQRPQRPSGVSR